MSKHSHHHNYLLEELANSLTHGIGAALSVAAFFILVTATYDKDTTTFFSCLVYGLSLIILYTASTLYHTVQQRDLKKLCRLIDHCSIYILIAGNYTPFCLITLRGELGHMLLGMTWGLTICGIVFKALFIGRFPVLSIILYLIMGWLALIAIQPLMDAMHLNGIMLLVGGGLAYTVGVVFFLWESLPYGHAIWHLFVLLGSTLHFLTVLLYVIE